MTISNKYTILFLHGPNFNLLGTREPDKYGTTTLDEINDELKNIAAKAGIMLECFQSNCEGALIDKTHQSLSANYDFLLINPGGYTHTSIAWRDAVLAVNKPFIEVHLSNIFAREEFRHKSFFADIAQGIIYGLGIAGYKLALNYAINYLLGKE